MKGDRPGITATKEDEVIKIPEQKKQEAKTVSKNND